MKYGILASWVVGLSLTAGLAALDCGGDDTTGTGGSAGSGGSSTTGKGGSAGSGGAVGSAGTAGKGGTAGSAGSGGTAGSAGSAGAGGSAGSPGDGGKPDGAISDASDASTAADRADGSVTFGDVTAILNARCITCHQPRDSGPPLLDLKTADGLYMRLTTPLQDNQDGTCGFGDAGTDGGDGGRTNRQPIVPSDPGASFLWLKVAGTQPVPGVNPPVGCGQRMPRIPNLGADGGPTGTSVGCDQADGGPAANCLDATLLDTILHWIEQGAPNN